MYVSSFRIFEARSCPHPVMSVFDFANPFVASFKSSAAIASMSSLVGIDGASGVGNHARESLTRVFIFIFYEDFETPSVVHNGANIESGGSMGVPFGSNIDSVDPVEGHDGCPRWAKRGVVPDEFSPEVLIGGY